MMSQCIISIFWHTELHEIRGCSDTSVAPSKRSLRTTPTRLNGGMTFQQVFNSQDPETPWHLHSTCMLWRMAWEWEAGKASGSSTGYRNEEWEVFVDVANLSTGLIVVQVHEWASCWQPLGPLRLIHKCLGESHTVRQVVTAPWPLEAWGRTKCGYEISGLLQLLFYYFFQYEPVHVSHVSSDSWWGTPLWAYKTCSKFPTDKQQLFSAPVAQRWIYLLHPPPPRDRD